MMDPWWKLTTPRKEVREGRSFNPDEFAIALEQVVAGRAPEDYQKPEQFFSRTCFTRALRDNSGLVLRRLAGKTEHTAPVQTLVTQMGGGKTHMLTTLWHLANLGGKAATLPGVSALLAEAGLPEAPKAKVAVFVGNAWDPQPGRETPWIDVARQLAGDEGVKALGVGAKDAPPGTDTINRLIEMVKEPVLFLFDELLNLFSRHRGLAEPMHAFLHNIVRGFVGSSNRAAVISLPRSQVEMTEWDLQWQDKIVKVVGAVAKPLLVNDEGEISEVIRRRLFEDLGPERTRKNVAKAFADWCFERRAQLPTEWTAVDITTTEKKAREFLQSRFESCYPFHPATLSVFQRKWQTLPQYQQTRGTLAMLAQWISWAYRDGFTQARREPLITLGSAPLQVPEFRSVVLGQLGESRLLTAIDTDIAGERSHARTLDADTKGVLRDIHRRVGTTILFESSGGQINKVAHLPELRFALGEPELDTTSVDTSAATLEAKAFFLQKVGADGYKIFHKAKIDKAVHDRKASLDEEHEVKPTICNLVKEEIKRGASIPVEPFPADSSTVPDSPRLSLVVLDPSCEWDGGAAIRDQIADWTKNRGKSSRLYPGALVWCVRKPGRDLREKVELLLAWRRVQKDVRDGVLGADFERADLREIEVKVAEAEEDAKDEVWAGYRFVVLADGTDPSGLKVIDLGAGHSSASETLCGRIIAALKAEALLNESVGAGYIDRNWPPAFKESQAWPLASLRQSFLNGALTRLLDPDGVLRSKIVDFVGRRDFGVASGAKPDGTYERVWFDEVIPPDEVTFEAGVFLLKKAKAQELKAKPKPKPDDPTKPDMPVVPPTDTDEPPDVPPPDVPPGPTSKTIRLVGSVPPELWNRLGTRILPKLKTGKDLRIGIDFSVSVDAASANDLQAELRQNLDDLGIGGSVDLE
ncbi:MAG TPA: DUF499 domain-containing protein [Gemmataceae bacterium]|nr:DUF499 domain-containing protein [Gemmataceae bacterium]